MKIIFLICEKYLLRYDVFVYDDYFTIWNDATFLMKIRWSYLQWYKMCFRKKSEAFLETFELWRDGTFSELGAVRAPGLPRTPQHTGGVQVKNAA